MALIKCPECGQDISTEASFCPHCGCTSIPKNTEGTGIAIVIFIVMVAFVACCTIVPANIATIVVPLIMLAIGLLIKNKVWKVLFIIWAIWTFLANIGNL